MPKYNLVLIITRRPGGTKPVPLNYIVSDEFAEGDKVMCETSKDWRPGYISSIKATDVIHLPAHKRVVAADKYDKEKDGSKMKKFVNDLFGLAVVESARGALYICKAVYEVPDGATVVYEGSDGNLHVGNVAMHVRPGEYIEVANSTMPTDGFIVDRIGLEIADEGRIKEKQYNELKAKLALRKKRFEEDAIWQMLAEKDEEAARLLAEMKGLKGEQ